MLDDTIVAISTPIGISGIGVIRISGVLSMGCILKIFIDKAGKKKNLLKSYHLHYGFIVDPDSGEKVDEVLVSYMRGPRSFTAEDVVEINCHGGLVAIKKVLELVLKSGARLAEPGEFSKRAFLNGRIDLAQAESIIDIINAKTEVGLKIAVNQLEGNLSKLLAQVNQKILELLAFIEAGIDFPEDEIEELSIKQINDKTQIILAEIDRIIRTADTGKIYRDGITTAIIGRTNVGKSSLLNALLKEKRAIVTEVPGTTRDVIEEMINIGGIPLKIIDTAGIRETKDIVEKIGIAKAKEVLKEADLVLFLVDAVQGLTKDDIDVLNLLENKKAIVIINKIDLRDFNKQTIAKYIKDKPILEVSAKEDIGIEDLEKQIFSLVTLGEVAISNEAVVANVRHKNALLRAKNHIKEVVNTISMGMPTDCMAIDLKSAWLCLGEISGETLEEDIIDKIFKDFCIGK